MPPPVAFTICSQCLYYKDGICYGNPPKSENEYLTVQLPPSLVTVYPKVDSNRIKCSIGVQK